MAEADEILIRIKADIKDLEKNMSTGAKTIENFGKKTEKSMIDFSKVAETALGFSLASLSIKAADSFREFAVQSGKNALYLERGLNSLQIQTNNTAESLIKDLRNASNNMVNSLELVQTANKALALGISKNQLPELMEVAAARAKIMGITTTQAFNDISIGIGRQSKLILDNLGIMIDLDKTYKNYADTMGIVGRELTDTEKKFAITNSIIEENQAIIRAQSVINEDLLTSIEKVKIGVQEMGIQFMKTAADDVVFLKNEITGFSEVLNDVQYAEASRQANLFSQEILNLDKANRDLNESLKIQVNELKNIRDAYQVAGASEFNLEQQKTANNIDTIKLALTKLKNNNLDDLKAPEFAEALNQAGINIENLGDKQKLVREDGNNQVYTTLTIEQQLNDMLETQRTKLDEQSIARKVIADNQIDLMQKQLNFDTEQDKQNEKTIAQIRDEIKSKQEGIKTTEEQILKNKDIISDYDKIVKSEQDIMKLREESIRFLLEQRAELQKQAYYSLVIEGASPTSAANSLNKGLSKLDTTNTTTPTPLTNPLTGTTVNVTIQNITAADPQEAATTLGDMFSNIFRTR